MKQAIKSFNKLISLCLFFSAFSSFAILICVIAADSQTADMIFKIIVPVIFWVGFAFEQFCIWKANSLRNQIEKRTKYLAASRRIGLLSFAKTTPGKISDIIFVVSLVVYIVCLVCKFGASTYQFVIIAIIVLSFRSIDLT